MSAHAATATRVAARERVLAQPVLDGLFLAAVLTVTFHKLQWQLAGSLTLSDVLTSVFLVVFCWDRLERGDTRLTRTAVVALGFLLAFALVYLAGFYALDTAQALAQWAKGMVKFVLHFGFLVTGVALLARRSLRFYWLALAAFCGGIALNALYGVVQLGLAEVVGANLDAALIEPITSRQTGINVFGAVGGTQEVFRPNALTGDPNHLGIELVIPLLVLTPLYLRLERGHRLRTPLAVLLVFLLVVELATLSRSGLLGLACGALVLALPYRRHFRRPAFLIPLGAVVVLVGAVILARLDFFLTVLRARTNTSSAAASPHFEVYGFVPDVLSTNPVLGLGLNNFAVYYEFVTGRPDFGPHSFYVATLVETGVLGAALFAVFVVWIFRRLGAARRLGRALAAAGDPLAARARPLAWGMTAALVATLVANLFYLTMTFYYFYVFAALAVALPVVFGRAVRRSLRILVLTTSYPRSADDVAGVFVRDAVENLRSAGARGRRRLARLVPALRARVRRRDRRKSPAEAVARHRAPALPPLVRPGGAARRPWSRRRPRALAALRLARARDAQAVRRAALGHRRRAGATRAVGRSAGCCGGPGSCCARRRRSRTRRESSARDDVRVVPSGVEIPGERRAARGSAARPLRRPALGREGNPRAAGGDGRPSARDRR